MHSLRLRDYKLEQEATIHHEQYSRMETRISGLHDQLLERKYKEIKLNEELQKMTECVDIAENQNRIVKQILYHYFLIFYRKKN